MPELPEVHTTVKGLQKTVVGLTILDVWTSYNSPFYKEQIKNPEYFKKFKKQVIGTTITDATRRAKNVLIHLSNSKTILIHMKMTGHMLFGQYVQKADSRFTIQDSRGAQSKWDNELWRPADDESEYLKDPYNRFIRLVFTLSPAKKGGAPKHLVLSDVRRFAKVQILDSKTLHEHPDLKNIGPEPLEKNFTFAVFKSRIFKRPNLPIKTALMMPELIAGIGNIYSDEILWLSGVHPESRVGKLPEKVLENIYKAIKPTLRRGIKFKGDSTSDYRNIDGKRGGFQGKHNVYRRTGEKCSKKIRLGSAPARRDGGIITRKIVRGRSAHFCSKHQVKY